MRPLTVADGEACALLHASGFPTGWPAADFARWIANPACVALGATVPVPVTSVPPLAGFVLAQSAGSTADILTVAVATDHRQKGLGRDLIEAALVELRTLGCDEVFLEVAATNTAARALYRRCDFSEVGRRASYYAAEVAGEARIDALVLRRDLTQRTP